MTTSDRADLDSEWQRKGATLSDKTARKEFGLTQDEIVKAIRAGRLHSDDLPAGHKQWRLRPASRRHCRTALP